MAGFLNQSEVIKAYIAADALVVPSAGETWGLVANEAMVCERPVFISDRVGCGPDLIEAGKTGEVVPVGDTEALARAIGEHADRGQLQRMGKMAWERIAAYSPHQAAESLVNAARCAVGRQ
jgi:glycosyltransferase involved in cell wall biosynthesis